MSNPPEAGSPLDPFRGSHRPVVIFTPFVDHDAYVQQRQIFSAGRRGMEERNTVVIDVVGEGQARLEDEPLPPSAAATLRRDLNVDVDDFTVVLVGTDGTEKLRVDHALPVHRLFKAIDEMPMRRQDG